MTSWVNFGNHLRTNQKHRKTEKKPRRSEGHPATPGPRAQIQLPPPGNGVRRLSGKRMRHAKGGPKWGSGCMKNTDRALRLVNGGFHLHFGVEKATCFKWLQMYLFRSPVKPGVSGTPTPTLREGSPSLCGGATPTIDSNQLLTSSPSAPVRGIAWVPMGSRVELLLFWGSLWAQVPAASQRFRRVFGTRGLARLTKGAQKCSLDRVGVLLRSQESLTITMQTSRTSGCFPQPPPGKHLQEDSMTWVQKCMRGIKQDPGT